MSSAESDFSEDSVEVKFDQTESLRKEDFEGEQKVRWR